MEMLSKLSRAMKPQACAGSSNVTSLVILATSGRVVLVSRGIAVSFLPRKMLTRQAAQELLENNSLSDY